MRRPTLSALLAAALVLPGVVAVRFWGGHRYEYHADRELRVYQQTYAGWQLLYTDSWVTIPPQIGGD